MNTLEQLSTTIKQRLAAALNLDPAHLSLVRNTKPNIDADVSLPLFAAAQQLKSKPHELASQVAGELVGLPLIGSVAADGGFVNIKLERLGSADALLREFGADEPYGHQKIGDGQTIVTDFSSPNIAKPFSVGHLLSTVIGDAINNLYRALGYTVIGDNHLGDWGTQFGKLAVAYLKWGDQTTVESSPIPELNKLYVRFHREISPDTSAAESPLEEEAEEAAQAEHPLILEARQWFRSLEAGDKEARQLWQWFVDLSLKDFERVYDLLGVTFEEHLGESFYEDKMPAVVEQLERDGHLITEPTGAKIIPPEKLGQDRHGNSFEKPLMVIKSDGATVYATRDLATAVYRQERWRPSQIIYVVGDTQEHYFQQVFQAMRLLGVTAKLIQPAFGQVLYVGPDGKKEKMSTREGRVVLLEDLISESLKRATAMLNERSKAGLTASEHRQVAEQIGIGAIKYYVLSRRRTTSIAFDWDEMLSLNGNSGPYLQYMVARINSLLRKSGELSEPKAADFGEPEWPLLRRLLDYPSVLLAAADAYEPHLLSTYLFGLSSEFSAYYDAIPIATESDLATRSARLKLVTMVRTVLEDGLKILGIRCPERM